MKLYSEPQEHLMQEAPEDQEEHGYETSEELPEIEAREIRSEDTAPTVPPPPPAESGEKKKGKHRALAALGVVAGVVLALVAGYAIWERPPEVGRVRTSPAPIVTVAPPAPSAAPTATEEPEESEKPEETEPPVEEDPGEAPALLSSPMHNSPRKEGVYTVLLVGVDKVSDSTDTIMVVTFDTENHKITGTSIPRDTLINIGFISPKKINTVFPAYGGGTQGMEGLMGEVRNVLGFAVDNYVVVYLQAVEDVVDAIGGVEYDVPYDMFYEDFVQGLWIDIKAGPQVLDGHNALNFCRFRDGYPGGDLERIEVQHDFLKEMATQVIHKGLSNIPGLVSVLLEDVDTDLTAANLAWFARQFLKCSGDDILLQTAPIGGGDLINGISFIGLDVYRWLDMINASINPYEDDVTLGDVNILTFGYGGYVGSTTGYIAGGYDSFYCLQCTINAGGQTRYHGPNGEHFTFGEPEPVEEQPPEEQYPEQPPEEQYPEQPPVEQYPEQPPMEQYPEEQYPEQPPEEQYPEQPLMEQYPEQPVEVYVEQPAEPYPEQQPEEAYPEQSTEQYQEPVVEQPPAPEEVPPMEPAPEWDGGEG